MATRKRIDVGQAFGGSERANAGCFFDERDVGHIAHDVEHGGQCLRLGGWFFRLEALFRLVLEIGIAFLFRVRDLVEFRNHLVGVVAHAENRGEPHERTQPVEETTACAITGGMPRKWKTDGEGFEPPVDSRLQQFSRLPP